MDTCQAVQCFHWPVGDSVFKVKFNQNLNLKTIITSYYIIWLKLVVMTNIQSSHVKKNLFSKTYLRKNSIYTYVIVSNNAA